MTDYEICKETDDCYGIFSFHLYTAESQELCFCTFEKISLDMITEHLHSDVILAAITLPCKRDHHDILA